MENNGKKVTERVMVVNRMLARKSSIIVMCVVADVFLFLMLQYLLNLILNIPLWVQDLDNGIVYIGFRNVFPFFSRIIQMPALHIIVYGSYVIVAAVLDSVLIYKTNVSFSEKYFNVGLKGVARWTTNQEIKEQYKEIPDRDKEFHGSGGTIISRIGKNLYIDQSPTNNLIIGITRSGKGEMFVFPSIDVYSRAEEKTSMVICDPKLELFKSSRLTLEKRGYDVYLLNLDDPIKSMGFNPLEQIKEEYLKKNYAEAELLAQSFSFSIFNPNSPTNTDAFWQDTASSLLTALILAHVQDCVEMDEKINDERYNVYKEKRAKFEQLEDSEKKEAKRLYYGSKSADVIMESSIHYIPDDTEFVYLHENEKKITMYSIINTFTELARLKDEDNKNLSALDKYFSERPPLDRAKLKYAGIEVAGDRTKGSIYASMLTKLTIFTFENIAKMTAESSLKLKDVGFGEKPIAVFLGIPDYDKSTHFLATVFIRQLTFVLEKMATRTKAGKCSRKVKFICDEFGNLPAIEGMESIITVCLGRNISFDLYIQAYSQIHKLYGDDAETICGNCGNQIFILTNDDNTAENFSKNLGNETVIDIQRSGDKLSMSKSFMESTMEKPLLNMNELMELGEGECVVKRVMKRQDLQRNRIRPTPIFNSEESGKRFLYRYEYLTKTFPNPDDIDLDEINKEDRSWIDHRSRVWDYNLSFKLIVGKQNEEKEIKRINKLENKQELLSKLKELLTREQFEKINEDISIAKLVDLINHSSIKEDEKNQIKALIELYMA